MTRSAVRRVNRAVVAAAGINPVCRPAVDEQTTEHERLENGDSPSVLGTEQRDTGSR